MEDLTRAQSIRVVFRVINYELYIGTINGTYIYNLN